MDIVPQLSSFLAGATGLPEDLLTQLVTDHIVNTKAVIDVQAGGDGRGSRSRPVCGAAHADDR